jgi:hypothetical protein
MKYPCKFDFLQLGLIWCMSVLSIETFAQNSVGIGTREPNANAALQVVASEGNQGVMIPGLTTEQRQASSFISELGESENGLLVFDTDEQVFYYWMVDDWQPLISGTVSQNVTAGAGIEILGDDEIVNTGDIDSTDDITTSTLAEGDLGGTFPALSILPGAVNTEKLADEAVTTLKVADNTLLPEDLASPGAGKVLISTNAGTVFWENQSLFGITFLQQGRIYIGDSGNQPSEVDMRGEGNILVGNGTSANAVPISGDISLSSTGNTQIGAGVVTTTEIADASVGTADLADGTVSTPKIQDGAVEISKIAADAVDASKIVDGTISSAELASGSVNSDIILDNSISDQDVSATAAIAGTKVNPDFGTQNITTSGSLNAGSATFTNKVSSDATSDTDPAATLTTKSYVDGQIGAITQPLEDGDGINDFTYDGTSAQSLSINAGRGLGFDAGQLVVSPGSGLDFDAGDNLQVNAVTSAMITDATLVDADVAAGASLQVSKLESLGDAFLILGDGTTNNAVSISGDATLANDGVLTLTSNAATTLGLGTLASQNADAVNISGGNISGINDLAIADGGTGASTAADARTNLGLGNLSIQNEDNVSISGGAIDGTVVGGGNPEAGTFTTLNAANLIGDGSALTNLDAANISAGTLDDARLNDTGPGAAVYGSTPADYISSIELDAKGRVINVTAGVPPSDQRLKEDLKKIESSLPRVLQLVPYQYHWKDHQQAGPSYGLIAQEVAKIYPDLVKERDDGYLGISYLELIPFLIKAIQEQQEEIASLKKDLDQKDDQAEATEIEQLRDENRQLRQDIEAIKAALGMDEPLSGQD